MTKEIKKYPNPILRKKADEIKEITLEIKELAKDLAETMLKSEQDAVGLAAPQIGISKRIFVVMSDQGPLLFINPRIIKKSGGTEVMEEGCLSLPKVWLNVKRAKEIEIEALDINNKKMRIKADGVFARILQHEIDHLNGILIVDKLNPWQKLKRTLKGANNGSKVGNKNRL